MYSKITDQGILYYTNLNNLCMGFPFTEVSVTADKSGLVETILCSS